MKTVDYESRRRLVLAAAISRYIKDAAPVASEDIASDFSLSSATIRNIFSELEESGYLTHPHTSAGRIPTDKGYRYYVDLLISESSLLNDEIEGVIDDYYRDNISDRLEDVLEKTSEILSTITHYASIVSYFDWQNKIFYKGISLILDQPEFQDFMQMRLLIKMFEEKEQLLHIINQDVKDRVRIYIGSELGCTQMRNCALAVSTYRIKSKPLGRLAVLGPMRMEYKHAIPALEYVSDILTEALEKI